MAEERDKHQLYGWYFFGCRTNNIY